MIQDWRGSFGFRSTSRIKLSRPVSVQFSGPINVEDSSPTTSFGFIALGRNGKVHFRTMYIVDLCFYSVTCHTPFHITPVLFLPVFIFLKPTTTVVTHTWCYFTTILIVNFLHEQSIEMSLLVKILLDGQANTVWALSVSTVNNRLSPSVIPTLGGIRFFPPCPIRFSQRGVPAGEWQAPDQSEHVHRGQGGGNGSAITCLSSS